MQLPFLRWLENQWPRDICKNPDKLLLQQGDASHKKKRKTNEPEQQSLQEVIENARGNEQPYQEEGHEVNPRTLSWKPNWSSYTVIRRSENSKPKQSAKQNTGV